MVEFLFELLGEFILQVLGEALLELGLHALAAPFRREASPWMAAAGYLIFGGIAGGVSLLAFPVHFTPAGPLRLANLFITPLAAGGCMAALGAWRARRGEPVLRIDRFLYGFLFAAAVAATRFRFAG
jgi:hypothetical protein